MAVSGERSVARDLSGNGVIFFSRDIECFFLFIK
jgi:hypothetical protein